MNYYHYQHPTTHEVRAVEVFDFAQPTTAQDAEGNDVVVPAVKSASELQYDQNIADGFPAQPMTAAQFEAFRNPPLTPAQLAAIARTSEISMRQARLALLGVGALGAVNAAINAMPSPQKEAALIWWEYSSVVRRDAPLVQSLAPALGLDDAALDALFTAAAKL